MICLLRYSFLHQLWILMLVGFDLASRSRGLIFHDIPDFLKANNPLDHQGWLTLQCPLEGCLYRLGRLNIPVSIVYNHSYHYNDFDIAEFRGVHLVIHIHSHLGLFVAVSKLRNPRARHGPKNWAQFSYIVSELRMLILPSSHPTWKITGHPEIP